MSNKKTQWIEIYNFKRFQLPPVETQDAWYTEATFFRKGQFIEVKHLIVMLLYVFVGFISWFNNNNLFKNIANEGIFCIIFTLFTLFLSLYWWHMFDINIIYIPVWKCLSIWNQRHWNALLHKYNFFHQKQTFSHLCNMKNVFLKLLLFLEFLTTNCFIFKLSKFEETEKSGTFYYFHNNIIHASLELILMKETIQDLNEILCVWKWVEHWKTFIGILF